MRKDMFKVIVERPRRGGKWGKDGREANTPLEDLPKRQGMKKKHQDRKSLNENLKPLERFFKSQVGRPWDKIFSEVCENIDSNSTVQNHVRQHIPHIVKENVLVKDGRVYYRGYFWRGSYSELWSGDLYVDPRTGILRKYKSDNRRYRWTNPSTKDQLTRALESLDIVLFQDELWKAERSKPRSPKYDKEKVSMVKANGTHAANDVRSMESRLRDFWKSHLTRKLYHDHEYLRVAIDLLYAKDERLKAQKEAEARKKAEQTANMGTVSAWVDYEKK